MLRLRSTTPAAWTDVALADLDAFLRDHAHNERKVSQSALALAKDNPHRVELVDAMIELAREELDHFQQVYQHLRARGGTLGFDQPDPYMTALRKLCRKQDVDHYLLDRLLVFGVVEARGCERFLLIADALPAGELKDFYHELTRSEARHHAMFTRFARDLYPIDVVAERLDAILDAEAVINRVLPLRPALH